MSKSLSKALLAGAFAALTIAFFVFDLSHYLSLDFVKSRQVDFQAFYFARPVATLFAFAAIYIVTTALSLPGATILTLAAGALFGLVAGVIIVSFASTVGATLAFLASRFVLRDWVTVRLGDKLSVFNQGVSREGAFYLFTLRLIPLFPFFIVNLVMGLTPLRAWPFYWVSQLGMLPGTIVYVNAGTELGRIDSLSGIVSLPLLVSFALLGLFPLIAKAVLGCLRSRRIYAKYRRPRSYDYNVVVIGAGSGGLVTAYIASAVKAKALLIEKHRMGGDCLNTGCVPSKAFIKSAKVLSQMRRCREFGISRVDVDFNFTDVMDRIHRVIKKVEPHDSAERYTKLGVDCLTGTAKITSPFTVVIDGAREITTRNIVIATGGRPTVPNLPGIEKVGYFTSDTIWENRTLPRRLLVLGGGPIGCELAQCFSRFGSRVTLVQSGPRVLPREDDDVADRLMRRFKSEGIELCLHHQAKEFVFQSGIRTLVATDERTHIERRIEFDALLVAVGRRANVSGFGLEELGVQLTPQGTVATDAFLRTNYPNIFACGDVAGPYQFTHFAAHQAWYCAVNSLFSPLVRFKTDYRVLPWVTYTDPEIARVGLCEKEAKAKGIPYEVSVFELAELDRAIAEEEDHGFVKVLTVPGKDRILGATVMGEHAGDTFVELVAAMKHGLGLGKILGTIHAYPTLAEANKYVAGVWKKNHAPVRLLTWVEAFHAFRRGNRDKRPETSSVRGRFAA